MTRICLFLAALFFTSSVMAEEGQKPALCDVLPQQDGVAYVGDHAVPADLNPIAQPIYDPIVIPVEVDIVDRFNLNVPDGVELRPEVASMKIYKDGRVEYNGQDISGDVQSLCNPEAETQNSNGQQGADELISEPAVIDDAHEVAPVTAKEVDGSIIIEGGSE